MTFEIPQKLKYEEKIIFKLTARQLFYLFIFAPLALFLLLKTSFSFSTRVSLSLIPCALGAVFMFTKLPQLGLALCKWLPWRVISQHPKNKLERSVEKYIAVDIQDEVIETK